MALLKYFKVEKRGPPLPNPSGSLNQQLSSSAIEEAYHATDGPPQMGPPGPSVANYVAMDGPPGPSTAAIDGPPGPSVAP